MTRSGNKREPVTISEKLRAANLWFEACAAQAKSESLSARRRKYRRQGKEPDPVTVASKADELETGQRTINRLLVLHKKLTKDLLTYWGYQGLTDMEIETRLGQTLIFPSFTLTVDAGRIRREISGSQWQSITRRTIDPSLLLAAAKNDPELRDLVAGTIRASAKINLVPPSSRRPKSGSAKKTKE